MSVSKSPCALWPMAFAAIQVAPQATPTVSWVSAPSPVIVPMVWLPCPLVSLGYCVPVPRTSSQHSCQGWPLFPRQRAETAGCVPSTPVSRPPMSAPWPLIPSSYQTRSAWIARRPAGTPERSFRPAFCGARSGPVRTGSIRTGRGTGSAAATSARAASRSIAPRVPVTRTRFAIQYGRTSLTSPPARIVSSSASSGAWDDAAASRSASTTCRCRSWRGARWRRSAWFSAGIAAWSDRMSRTEACSPGASRSSSAATPGWRVPARASGRGAARPRNIASRPKARAVLRGKRVRGRTGAGAGAGAGGVGGGVCRAR